MPSASIEELIGEGAFGKVFKVEEQGVLYAVKKIMNIDTETENEKKLLQLVNHKNIIKYHSFYTEGPLFCLQMEYADRGSFTAYVERNAKLPNSVNFQEWNVWRFIVSLSSALHYLHTLPQPILHRDLKPDNILCITNKTNKNGNTVDLKLADFGLSKLLKPNTLGQFYATSIKGTPIYMAKELATAWMSGTEPRYSSPADVYSLGCVVAYLCNKGTKHMLGSFDEIRNWAGLTLDQDKIPGHYSFDLVRVVGRMVDPDPKARLSAGEVFDECTGDRQELGKH